MNITSQNFQKPKKRNQHRINYEITEETIRITTTSASQILPIKQAIAHAKSQGMDVIEISRSSKPPVCKIQEYGRFLYELEKSKKNSPKRKTKTKEIGLRPNVAEHDLQTKLKAAEAFLTKKCQVLFRLRFKGRENTHKNLGEQLLKKIVENLSNFGSPESTQNTGNTMLLRICPK